MFFEFFIDNNGDSAIIKLLGLGQYSALILSVYVHNCSYRVKLSRYRIKLSSTGRVQKLLFDFFGGNFENL